jgi:hypothetical protein
MQLATAHTTCINSQRTLYYILMLLYLLYDVSTMIDYFPKQQLVGLCEGDGLCSLRDDGNVFVNVI